MKRLADEQRGRRKRLDDLWARYEGNPPLPEGAESAFEAYRAFQKKARTNYADLIVSAVTDRMTLVGFRTGAEGDENGDTRARELWTYNDLPVESSDVHEMMVTMSEGYTMVGPPDPEDDTGLAIITAEDPRQTIVARDPARPSRVLAGMKWYYDDIEEKDTAHVFIRGGTQRTRMYTARKDRKSNTSSLGPNFRLSPRAWTWDDPDGVELPTTRVPIIPFRNRRGVGEFEQHVDHLDRINHILLQRMVIATLQAFKQRAVIGVPNRDPDTGEEIDYSDIFTADPGAMWALPATASMWESGAVDLGPLLMAVRDDVRDLAGVTRTPLSWLAPDAANSSAEGASLQREGSTYKAEDRITRAGSGWVNTTSIAFEMMGDTVRADVNALEPLWAPVERHSLAERYSAAAQGNGIVPWRTLMTDVLQFTPDQVARMETERIMDQLLAPETEVENGPANAAPTGEPVRTEPGAAE